MKERRAVSLVAVGGFVGAASRYLVGLALPDLASTLFVNVVGCFALGYLLYAYRLDGVSEEVRLLAAVGFLSSFTTYSTFVLDVFTSRPAVAVAYVSASYLLGFSATYAGSRFATGGHV